MLFDLKGVNDINFIVSVRLLSYSPQVACPQLPGFALTSVLLCNKGSSGMSRRVGLGGWGGFGSWMSGPTTHSGVSTCDVDSESFVPLMSPHIGRDGGT
jgi:hypothetical protein